MKSSFKYLILLIMSMMIYQSKASEPDSLYPESSWVYPHLIGGVGMTNGSAMNYWSDYFYNGPAMLLGLELPFTTAHIFSLQVYGHSWICKKRESASEDDTDSYKKVSENFYSLIGVSFSIKYYLYLDSGKNSFSFYLGKLIYNKSKEISWFDFGIGFNHRINERIMLSIMNRSSFPRFNLDGGSPPSEVPDYLMLEFSYKIM